MRDSIDQQHRHFKLTFAHGGKQSHRPALPERGDFAGHDPPSPPFWGSMQILKNNVMKVQRRSRCIWHQHTELVWKLSRQQWTPGGRTPRRSKTSGTMEESRSTTPREHRPTGTARSLSLDDHDLMQL